MANKLLVVIGGPTGSGKTALAISLARHFQTEIISADSRQVYAELRIGVGRPSPAQLEAVPHHLIAHRSIHENYSAGQFAREALDLIDLLFASHDIVFLTGGTGLYVKAIMEGFDEMPAVSDAMAAKWTNTWKEHGTQALVDALETMDPDYLQTVDTANPMRLIRALAVTESSGKPYSSFRTGTRARRSFDILPIVLEVPRDMLYAKINQRVLDMVADGWLDEAKGLYAYRDVRALQTVGYKELFQHLEGQCTLPEAISAIQQSTRRYAKRQMTWWRHQGEWLHFHPDKIEEIIDEIRRHL